MRKCFAEALGTFGLVFAGTGAIVVDQTSGGAVTHVGVALTFGLIVMAMIYAFGDISGAHINPAVTLGFAVAGRLPARRVLPYMLAQTLGAIAASLLLRILFPASPMLGTTLPAGSAAQSLVLEIVLTFFLMLVILQMSSGPRESGLMAGIAIGGVVGLEALFAGPICGASMNPARSLAPALVSGHFTSLWLYLVGPVIGSILAVPCSWLVREPMSSICKPAHLECAAPADRR
jgi:aquaporin NIP